MPFEQAFRLSTIVLAATAFAGLVLAHSVPLWLAVLTSIIFTVTLRKEWNATGATITSGQQAHLPHIWNVLLIGAFGLFLMDLFILSGELLTAGIRFLVMLLGIKLCTLRQTRDYRHLYAVSLMAVLASAALTTDVWYLLIFLLYLIGAVWTLLLHHLTVQQTVPSPALTAKPSSHGPISSRITRHFFWLTNGLAIVTFSLTLVIFFALPRIGVGMMQKTSGPGLKTTGFSERVDLGTIGSIKQDPQIVMRVELPDQPASGHDSVYLRGLAYDRYDGRAWSTSSSYRRHLNVIENGTFLVDSSGPRRDGHTSHLTQQDILLEALDTSVLFAAPFAESLSGEFMTVQIDHMGGLHLPYHNVSRVRYSVTSRTHEVSPEEQSAPMRDYSRPVYDRYLQTPVFSPRVAELANHVTQQAATPFEKVVAIQQHLLRSYQYSLDIETTQSESPIEDFLFERKTGYCEHYATAMVMMLRAIGIPARLVTGFLATEWNDFGNYFTVRQRDAHAWVEVYFPRSGWVSYDPTPVAAASVPSSRWEALYRLSESLRLHWDRLFIHYSARDQLALLQGIRENGDVLRDRLSPWISALTVPFSEVFGSIMQAGRAITFGARELLITLCVFGLAVILLMIRDRLALWATTHLPQSRRHLAIVHLYNRMLRILAKHGMNKSPTSTPHEFLRKIEQERQAARPIVDAVTELYCQSRYGGTALSHDALLGIAEQIGQLPRILRAPR